FSPDGKVLASAGGRIYNDDGTHGEDGTVRLWSTETHQQIGDPLINERSSGPALAVSFAPGGEKLAVGYGDRDGMVWDIGTHKLVGTLPGTYGVMPGITYSHAGSLIAAGDSSNVRIWDGTTYKLLRDVKGQTGSVNAMAFSPDDGHLASAAQDDTIRIWDPTTGTLVKQLTA
ncbi:MAG TPA: hypothetical protein VL652_06725, partial [Kutzneria sp.]|nr:hypothetical protein [Kutzneria sp.]